MGIFPPIFAAKGWYTSTFIAGRLKRSPRTIQYWCKTGFFTRRGCIVLLPPRKGVIDALKGQPYWIFIPPMTKDAILSKIAIDSTPIHPLPLAEYEGNQPRSGANSL